MKDQYYHIYKLFFCSRRKSAECGKRSMVTSMIFCLVAAIVSFQAAAQDVTDSLELFHDSAYVSATDDEYENRARKFSQEAVFRTVPDTTVVRMKKEKEFAYANDPAYWVREKKVYKKGFIDHVFDFLQSDMAKLIFWIFVSALVVFVIYRIIVVNDLLIFYSSRKKRMNLEDSATTETNPLLIDQQVQEAINQKQYNVAVRYLYIKTLYALNEKKWIQFHAEATNSEYLNQMSQHKLNKEFRFLTRAYEYMWYGKFEVSEEQFALVHDNFKNFHAGI